MAPLEISADNEAIVNVSLGALEAMRATTQERYQYYQKVQHGGVQFLFMASQIIQSSSWVILLNPLRG